MTAWDPSLPATDERDVGNWEVTPSRNGVFAEMGESAAPEVPENVQAQLRERAEQEGGPVSSTASVRFSHDLATRETETRVVLPKRDAVASRAAAMSAAAGGDGIELMRDILGVADVPVIFISAYGRDNVVARAFEAGAADYIVKPFSSTELVARVRAALRRGGGPYRSEPPEPYVLGDLTIDYAERLVTLTGRPVQLTATEYRLLAELSVNAGRVLTHDQLMRRVWGPKKPSDLRSLRTHLRRLRRKLGEDASNPTYFFAEPRVGYRMAKGETSGSEEAE